MTTIFIEDKPYEAREGDNLLQTVLSLGFDLPYFCWHPALHSVGACRQCAVKQFKGPDDKKGMIVMACMTPVTDGMRISISDAEAREFRAAVIGWLMTNHPHDCPICDEGGECHLQDMTVMTGHTYRKFRFNKRTFRNQDLGPFIHHEMNRCIQCYRCVRFYRDYAGGRDLDVFGSRNKTYFGRLRDGVLKSPFSGNLVEICPTGVFTDKTLKEHYTRKWDLTTAPSVCALCGLGCNTLPGERYGTLRRILNRYNSEVNGYFLCDRGRFGYEFANSRRRIRNSLIRREDTKIVSKEDALLHTVSLLKESKGVVGIGSPRASLEANFALRTLVGPDHFFNGMGSVESRWVSSALEVMKKGPTRFLTLREVEQADAIVILGEDVTNTAPILDLKVRKAVHQPGKHSRARKISPWNDAMRRLVVGDDLRPLFIASPHGTCLDEIATDTFRGAPDDIAGLGFAAAHLIDEKCPAAGELSKETLNLAGSMARALQEAERPLIIAGFASGSEAVLRAAANLAWSLSSAGKEAGIFLTFPESNSVGAALISSQDLTHAFETVEKGKAETVIVLENDLFQRAEKSDVLSLLEKAKRVVIIDFLENGLTEKADAVLPAATIFESNGTLVNAEGRAQRFFQVFNPEDSIQASWRWIADILKSMDREDVGNWTRYEEVAEAMAAEIPVFASIMKITPPSGYRMPGGRVPRQAHRFSGRTAMRANLDVSEPKPPDDLESPLSFSMEGSQVAPPSALISRYWSPGWNSVQALNKFQDEVGGSLRDEEPGLRLVEPEGGGVPSYYINVPVAFRPRPNEWLVVGIHHLFGSEALSLETPAVAEQASAPYLALNFEDVSGLDAREGDIMEIDMDGHLLRVPLKTLSDLPRGLAGLPVGLRGVPPLDGEAWIRISKVS